MAGFRPGHGGERDTASNAKVNAVRSPIGLIGTAIVSGAAFFVLLCSTRLINARILGNVYRCNTALQSG